MTVLRIRVLIFLLHRFSAGGRWQAASNGLLGAAFGAFCCGGSRHVQRFAARDVMGMGEREDDGLLGASLASARFRLSFGNAAGKRSWASRSSWFCIRRGTGTGPSATGAVGQCERLRGHRHPYQLPSGRSSERALLVVILWSTICAGVGSGSQLIADMNPLDASSDAAGAGLANLSRLVSARLPEFFLGAWLLFPLSPARRSISMRETAVKKRLRKRPRTQNPPRSWPWSMHGVIQKLRRSRKELERLHRIEGRAAAPSV